MMNQQQHPVTSAQWSILIDIHAKIGDTRAVSSVIDEMVAQGWLGLAGVYVSWRRATKVCTDGRISHSVRKRRVRWVGKKWQEMRIVGLDPDVMAYGAIPFVRSTGTTRKGPQYPGRNGTDASQTSNSLLQ
jgi:pentatricopeptide repeat protein